MSLYQFQCPQHNVFLVYLLTSVWVMDGHHFSWSHFISHQSRFILTDLLTGSADPLEYPDEALFKIDRL